MKTFTCFVTGIPKGQPRVKAFRRGAHAGVYDPGTADGWKLLVRHEVGKAWDRAQMLHAISLALEFQLPRPKAHWNKKGELRHGVPTMHAGKPDADNAAKAIMDALTNLGVWRDDSQVWNLTVSKRYGYTESGCRITVTEWLEP